MRRTDGSGKGTDPETVKLAEDEARRCEEMGVEPNKIYKLEDMARSDDVVFSATGITKGDLLEGIRRRGNLATTETLLIRGKSRTVRKIQSTHYLDRKDDDIKEVILK
jgi:fructose-1,6-bisphosphatase II